MEDKLKDFIDQNDFDVFNPHQGHQDRFLKKLNQSKGKKTSWKWLSIAASITLLIGFYLGSNQQKEHYNLTDVSPKMEEAQSFFVNTINQELREIEKYRNINTETLIEDALEGIEELEDQYKNFNKDLKVPGNERHIIQGMINNYQRRLDILEDLLQKLEYYKNPAKLQIEFDETI